MQLSEIESTHLCRVPSVTASLEPGHETLGSTIRALVDALPVPDLLLGADEVAALRTLPPESWCPVSTHVRLVQRVRAQLGDAVIRSIGATIFAATQEGAVRAARPSVRTVVFGFDRLYRSTNRGPDIGSWQVARFSAGDALLQKTTPHDCVLDEGFLEAMFRTLQVPVVIYQESCVRNGADRCDFRLASHVVDARWTGGVAADGPYH
jgi:hypothetical protein